MSFPELRNKLFSGSPGLIEALIMFVLIMVYMMYGGPLVNALAGKAAMNVFTLGLAALPLLFSYDIKTVFSIKKASVNEITGAMLLAAGMFLMTLMLSSLLTLFVPETERKDVPFLAYVANGNILLVILSVAILPAFCEEILFRGFILSGLKTAAGKKISIFLCALMFALMHLDPYRIPFTLAIGIGLSWAAWETGSLIIPIVMHGAHNLALLLITRSVYLKPSDDLGTILSGCISAARHTVVSEIGFWLSSFLLLACVVLLSLGLIISGIRFLKPKKYLKTSG